VGGASLQNALNEQSVTLNLRLAGSATSALLSNLYGSQIGEAQYELAVFTSALTKCIPVTSVACSIEALRSTAKIQGTDSYLSIES